MSKPTVSNRYGAAAEPPSLAWLLISGAGGALAALVVAGIVAGRLGLPISADLLLGAALIGALPQALALVRGRWRVRWPQLAAAAVALAVVGGVGLALAWPSLLPLGLSVDAIHHTQLIAWIAERAALPQPSDDIRGLLGEMMAYPVGMALVVVAAARASGGALLEVTYPAAALVGGLIAALVVLLSSAAARADGHKSPLRSALDVLALLIGPLLLLAHRTYLMEAYIDHSYYTMVLGVFLVLLIVGWLVVEPGRSRGSAAQLGLALAALMGTYPLWTPLPAALAIVAIWRERALVRTTNDEGQEAKRRGMKRLSVVFGPWSLALGRLALALIPALALALLDVLPRLRLGQTVLAHEGLVTLPTAQRLTPILLALPCAPLLAGVRRGRRLLLMAGLAVLAILALALLARAGLAAGYHSYKILFILTPLAAAIVGAAAVRLLSFTGAPAEQPARRRLPSIGRSRMAPLVGVGALALALALTGSFQVVPPPAIQILNPDLVAAARWLRANSPPDAARAIVAGAPAGPLSYWLQIGLLGQRRDRAETATRAFTVPPPSPESWLIDKQLAPVAIVPSLGQPLPGMTVAARFGSAAVLRRAPRLDTTALNPLVIRYETFWEDERLKTAIELTRPLPGPMPRLELRISQAGTTVSTFALPPDPSRTRTQYLGADVLPDTLGGVGYVNAGSYPTFEPPAVAPTGPLSLTLRLSLAGNAVDERLLATFERSGAGRFEAIAPSSGELIYLRHDAGGDDLRDAAIDFEGTLRLTGWRAPSAAAQGAPLEVALRWQAPRPIDRSLFPAVLVLDSQGRTVAQSLEAPQGGFYPTWRWQAGESVTERRSISLPAGLAPGVYRLGLQVHDFVGQRVLSAGDGEVAPLGEIVVEQ